MGSWKDSAKTQFDSWSRSYDRSVLQRIFFRPSHELILNTLSVSQGDRVLDIGCGTGVFACRLAEQMGAQVVGLDISDGMLNQARHNATGLDGQVEFVLGDSEHLPFDDDNFDLVTCVHSFHHYPNKIRVLSEIHRVLRDNGRVAIVDGNRDGWWGWFVFDGVVTTIERNVHHCSGQELRDLAEAVGFDDVGQVTGGHVAPFMLTYASAWKVDQQLREAA